MFNVQCSIVHTVQCIHDLLQLFLVVEMHGDFSLALRRTGHLHLHMEQFRQTVSQNAVLQWQLLGVNQFLNLLQ